MRKIKQMINDVLDKQEQKGIKTYGQTLEDCPDYAYDWQNMALEELVDAVQYMAKENLRLQKLAGDENPHIALAALEERIETLEKENERLENGMKLTYLFIGDKTCKRKEIREVMLAIINHKKNNGDNEC